MTHDAKFSQIGKQQPSTYLFLSTYLLNDHWDSLVAVHTCLFTSPLPPINFPQQFTTIKIQDPTYSLFSVYVLNSKVQEDI